MSGIGRTNAGSRGGSISNAFAVIAVSYPVDGVCTCTDGVKMLKATGSTGFYVFTIPYAGTWVISVTNGIDTSSKSVVISNQYQVESVALEYTVYLFRNGEYDGTWEGKPWWSGSISWKTAPSITESNTLYLSLGTDEICGGIAANNQALDTNKTTLSYSWTSKNMSSGVTIKPIVFTPYRDGFTRTIEGNAITTNSGTETIDISSLTSGSSYYFCVLMYKQGGTANITFSEVKLT